MIILHFCYLVAGAVRSEKAIFHLVIPGIWLVGTAAVLVADVVASIQYGLDLGKILVRHSSSLDKIINAETLSLRPNFKLWRVLMEVYVAWAFMAVYG
jgi:hypothetical protein